MLSSWFGIDHDVIGVAVIAWWILLGGLEVGCMIKEGKSVDWWKVFGILVIVDSEFCSLRWQSLSAKDCTVWKS